MPLHGVESAAVESAGPSPEIKGEPIKVEPLLDDKSLADVCFVLGKQKDARVEAHRALLSRASKVFESMLAPPPGTPKNLLIVELPDVDGDVFQALLDCVYTGHTSRITEENFAPCFEVANLYQVVAMQTCVIGFLESGEHLTPKSVLQVLGRFKSLDSKEAEFVWRFLEQHAQILISSASFVDTEPELLRRLLQRDYLSCSEYDLFKAVLLWGQRDVSKQQEKRQDQNGARESKDSKVAAVREALKGYLPLIRFPTMTDQQLLSVAVTGLLPLEEIDALKTYVARSQEEKEDGDAGESASAQQRFKYSTISRGVGTLFHIQSQENRFRAMFAKGAKCGKEADSLLINVYENEKSFMFPPEVEYSKPSIPILFARRRCDREDGPVIASQAAFFASWYHHTLGILEGLDWSNLCVAGGAVTGSLLRCDFVELEVKKRLDDIASGEYDMNVGNQGKTIRRSRGRQAFNKPQQQPPQPKKSIAQDASNTGMPWGFGAAARRVHPEADSDEKSDDDDADDSADKKEGPEKNKKDDAGDNDDPADKPVNLPKTKKRPLAEASKGNEEDDDDPFASSSVGAEKHSEGDEDDQEEDGDDNYDEEDEEEFGGDNEDSGGERERRGWGIHRGVFNPTQRNGNDPNLISGLVNYIHDAEIGDDVFRYAYGNNMTGSKWPYTGADIDVFFINCTEKQALKKLKSVFATLQTNMPKEKIIVVRTSHAITFVPQWPRPHVQCILRTYQSISEVLVGFDLDSVCCAFDGEHVYTTQRGRHALRNRINIVDETRQSTTYESRLFKYSRRGFSVGVPGYRSDKLDLTLFGRSISELRGLAKLLRLDAVMSERPRDFKATSAGVVGDNAITESDYDGACPWLSSRPFWNNLASLTHAQAHLVRAGAAVPFYFQENGLDEILDARKLKDYSAKASKSLVSKMKTKDLDTARLENVFYRTNSVVALPVTPKFIITDPGRQYSGSFHPLQGDWFADAYGRIGNRPQYNAKPQHAAKATRASKPESAESKSSL